MRDEFCRSEMLLPGCSRVLAGKAVLLFGLGGVGGACAEALARMGVGRMTLVDGDVVEPTNLNRQIVALRSTLGRSKAAVMAERVADINPAAEVTPRELFYLPENAAEIGFSGFDYVIDAVDTVTAKLAIIARAKAEGIPVISCMGTGNKLDPLQFRVADVSKTRVCPLCRVMRGELKKRGISGVKAVYSEESPLPVAGRTPGSLPFVPPVAGMLLAREVVLDLLGYKGKL